MVLAIVEPLGIACPACRAPPYEPCRGRVAAEPHYDRVRALHGEEGPRSLP